MTDESKKSVEDTKRTLNLEAYTELENNRALMDILLSDNSSGSMLVWATDDYEKYGPGYSATDPMLYLFVTKKRIIRPRTLKSLTEQISRSKEMAEVFTPSWIVNKQNNLADNQWIGVPGAFNTETDDGWIPTKTINLGNRSWKDYVDSERLEICCGEAPYLTTRYDAVSGIEIPVNGRVGFLDRKLRLVSENTENPSDWIEWAKLAVQRTYGYDFQGDNVLLARENLLLTYIEHYRDKFGDEPPEENLLEIAQILSWNIWQMDGMKYVIPYSCQKKFGNDVGPLRSSVECKACKTGIGKHIGTYCKIKDWREGKISTFYNLVTAKNTKKKRSLKMSDAKNVVTLDNW